MWFYQSTKFVICNGDRFYHVCSHCQKVKSALDCIFSSKVPWHESDAGLRLSTFFFRFWRILLHLNLGCARDRLTTFVLEILVYIVIDARMHFNFMELPA